MASPAAAASGALVRQYFSDETFRYWTAVCNGAYSKFCSERYYCMQNNITYTYSHESMILGVLLKAALLHSGGEHGQLLQQRNLESLGSPPDNVQGYGIVDLSNVLPLPDGSPFDLFVDDLRTIAENSMVTYTVAVQNSNYPLKITISWYDYPNTDGFTGTALINDLNLEAVSAIAGSRQDPNI